jgi:hypothetical protein
VQGLKVNKKTKRGGFSHVATVTDDNRVQHFLPQLLILPTSICNKKDFDLIEEDLPFNVFVARNRSGFNTTDLFIWMISAIRRMVEHVVGQIPIVLIMDSAPCHLAPSALMEMRINNIVPFLIPAASTHVLQPLDVYVFATYKRYMKSRWTKAVAKTGGDEMTITQFVILTTEVMKKTFSDRDWSRIFDRCGFGHQQECVSTSIGKMMTKLHMTLPFAPSFSRTELTASLPSNRCIPVKVFDPEMQAGICDLLKAFGVFEGQEVKLMLALLDYEFDPSDLQRFFPIEIVLMQHLKKENERMTVAWVKSSIFMCLIHW